MDARSQRALLMRIELLERTVEVLATRLNSVFREGKVTEVDPETGTATVNAHGINTDFIPWLEQAGDIVDWNPPAVGQRVLMVSPNGDMQKGFILPGGFTDDVPKQYSEGTMYARVLGDTKVEVRSDSHYTETETFRIKGNLIVEGNVDFQDGHVKHNGTDIGDTHKHTKVVPGPALTGEPA